MLDDGTRRARRRGWSGRNGRIGGRRDRCAGDWSGGARLGWREGSCRQSSSARGRKGDGGKAGRGKRRRRRFRECGDDDWLDNHGGNDNRAENAAECGSGGQSNNNLLLNPFARRHERRL